MTDLVALFQAGCATFGARVHRVDAEQWPAGTPCTEWSVADLVDHLIDEHLWVPPLLSGHRLETAGAIVKSARHTLEGDRPAAWDAASLASARAFAEQGALDRDVALSRGSTAASEYISEMIFDLTVHSWDLGRAIGMNEALPAELVAFTLPFAESFSGDTSPWFAPPQPAPADASDEERLIALTGRRPR